MKVFVVILEDRHIDIEVEVFKDKGKALDRAEAMVIMGLHRDEKFDREVGFKLNEAMIRSNWIFHYIYSYESDSVRVQEVELQD